MGKSKVKSRLLISATIIALAIVLATPQLRNLLPLAIMQEVSLLDDFNDGSTNGWQIRFTQGKDVTFQNVGGRLYLTWYQTEWYLYKKYDFTCFGNPLTVSYYHLSHYAARVHFGVFDLNWNRLYDSGGLSGYGGKTESLDIAAAVGKEVILAFFHPLEGQPTDIRVHEYIDNVKVTGYVSSGYVKLKANVNPEGHGADEIKIPVTARDAVDKPVPYLVVSYEISVGSWLKTGVVTTDTNGLSFIDEKGAADIGQGTLTLTATKAGETNRYYYPITILNRLRIAITGETIQYLNVPVKATIKFSDARDSSVEPDQLQISASLNGRIVSGSLSRVATGEYLWSMPSTETGMLQITADASKFGYSGKPSSLSIELKKPFITVSHNVPTTLQTGTRADILIKTLNPQKEMIDPARISVTIRDPFDVQRTVTLSRVSLGVYSFNMLFDKQGLYYFEVSAENSGYEPATVRLSVTSSTVGGPATDIAKGFFTSPIVLGVAVALIVFAVLRRLRRGARR